MPMPRADNTGKTPGQHVMFYFALLCPEPVDQRVNVLKQWVRDHHGAKVALKSPAHITLLPPFWWPAKETDSLASFASNFQHTPDALHIQLKGFGHFGKRVIYAKVVDNITLTVLHESFSRYMKPLLEKLVKEESRPFSPHVTIASRDLSPSAFVETWAVLSKQDFDADMTISEISLMVLRDGKWEVFRSFPWARKTG
jgi:2'-5' RNA ligase